MCKIRAEALKGKGVRERYSLLLILPYAVLFPVKMFHSVWLFLIVVAIISKIRFGDLWWRYKNLKLIQEKVNEIQTLLKYTDLKSFGEHMSNSQVTNTVERASYEEELHVIENSLAEEFTMLFYIALMRKNNHVAWDYPLTIGIIIPHPDSLYPKDILMSILSRDIEIRNKIKKWITETIDYQKRALSKMDEMLKEISWYK